MAKLIKMNVVRVTNDPVKIRQYLDEGYKELYADSVTDLPELEELEADITDIRTPSNLSPRTKKKKINDNDVNL